MAENGSDQHNDDDRSSRKSEDNVPAKDKQEYDDQEPQTDGPSDQESQPDEEEQEAVDQDQQQGGSGQVPGVTEPDGEEKPSGDKGLGRLAAVLVPIALLVVLAVLIRGATPAIYQADNFYVQDQIILSGPEQAVDGIINRLALNNDLALNTSLTYTTLLDGTKCPGLPGASQGQPMVVNLYDITRNTINAGEILRSIRASQQAPNPPADQGNLARAEPNWISGQPWEIEGGPWEIEGGPWEIEGGSTGASGITGTVTTDSTTAMKQWGLGSISHISTTTASNPGVRIAIFDTSPFTMPTGLSGILPVGWVTSPTNLSLLVTHPISSGPKPKVNLSDHGLFVSGLAHTVSPMSEIELIRVLQDNNRGDLFTLIEELYAFIDGVDNGQAVANLSLGLRLMPDDARGFQDLSREVDALRDLLAIAHCKNIVVVAAAGNGSADLGSPLTATAPAEWQDVIGVAASNITNDRSCYSNQGDIAAPGGDGGSSQDYPNATCVPLHYTCTNVSCPNAVVGPIVPSNNSSTGYAYWVGSSFATPLVSGLAARLLEEDGTLSADNVRDIIECSAQGSSSDADLGAGVINVERALNVCLTAYSGAAAQ